MAEQKRVIIVCGEASGDLHAASLIRAIHELDPAIEFSGVGGPLMEAGGAKIYHDIKGLSCIGLFDVLKKLPRFFALKKLILKKIITDSPDAVILVDFSGFNLRLAKAINKKVPVIYYISPQVWASRAGRLATIKKYVNKMIVVFKFEEDFYKKFGIDAEFTGHPLLDIVHPSFSKSEFLEKFALKKDTAMIALLPGSRPQEIKNILPIMLKTAALINKKINNLQFVIVKPSQLEMSTYSRLITESNLDLKIIEGHSYDCLDNAKFALVASGTATLETALMEKPFIIIYKMNLLNYLLYRPQVKLPFIGMVNIIARKKIIPEFIQFDALPIRIAQACLKIINDTSEIERIKNELKKVRTLLGDKGSSFRAAEIILKFLK